MTTKNTDQPQPIVSNDAFMHFLSRKIPAWALLLGLFAPPVGLTVAGQYSSSSKVELIDYRMQQIEDAIKNMQVCCRAMEAHIIKYEASRDER